MQIVINIDDDVYKRALVYKDIQLASNKANDLSELITVVANGTPLPKGHGDLKDIAEIERLWQKGDYDSIVSALLFAPTIIEADKEVDL